MTAPTPSAGSADEPAFLESTTNARGRGLTKRQHAALASPDPRDERIAQLERVLRSIADTKLEEDDEEYEMSMDIAYSKLSEIVNDARTIMGRE